MVPISICDHIYHRMSDPQLSKFTQKRIKSYIVKKFGSFLQAIFFLKGFLTTEITSIVCRSDQHLFVYEPESLLATLKPYLQDLVIGSPRMNTRKSKS